MHVGVISDVHANKPALEAVLEALPTDLDLLVNAGDIVGYNPWPKACLDTIQSESIPSVSGNHDRAIDQQTPFRFNRMARAGIQHAQTQLTTSDREWLTSLPTSRTLLDGRIKMVHGHPDDPDRYTYPQEFSSALLEDEELLVMGHTHYQHAETYPEGIIINPGSVGQPRDGDPRAAFAVVDLATRSVTLDRVPYDTDRVIAAIEESGLPKQTGQRLKRGE